MVYIILAAAIVAEVIATTALAKTDGFTQFWPSVVSVIGYGIALFFLSIVTRVMPVGVVYALWSGAGIVLVVLNGWLIFGDQLDLPALSGLVLIIAGVLIINLMSKTITH